METLETFTAVDGMVIAMLAAMALSLSVIALLLLCMHRNAKQRDHQLEKLLEETADEEDGNKPISPIKNEMPPCESWERDADWWK
jgi:hypothetical protein